MTNLWSQHIYKQEKKNYNSFENKKRSHFRLHIEKYIGHFILHVTLIEFVNAICNDFKCQDTKGGSMTDDAQPSLKNFGGLMLEIFTA